MTTPRRATSAPATLALGAVLCALLGLAGCSSEAKEASPTGPRASTPGTSSSGTSSSGIGGSDLESLVPTARAGEEGPATPAPLVAMKFQNLIFGGDAEACDLLTAKARKEIAKEQVRAGKLPKGSTCGDYVATVAASYGDAPPTASAYPVDETEEVATVRIEMQSKGSNHQTQMTLRVVDGEWRIAQWGVH